MEKELNIIILKQLFFGQSIKEMKYILNLIGGGEENIIYGAGDLYVTILEEELEK